MFCICGRCYRSRHAKQIQNTVFQSELEELASSNHLLCIASGMIDHVMRQSVSLQLFSV